jgi:hypothetical protein
MKSHLLVLLTLASTLHAQEPNPFVKKGEAAKAEVPAGDSFTAVVEHILVPPDAIAEWIRNNSIADDADGLRAAVQQWIDEGKATLDHTHIGTGVAGRKAETGSVVELIYPTEYEPAGPEVWPLATSFETRNTGVSAEFHAHSFREGPRLSMWVDHVAYVGSRAWDILASRTRHPDDVMMPEFRSTRASWAAWEDIRQDPFSEKSATQEVPPSVQAPAPLPDGKYELLSRVDPNLKERQQGLPARLVFLRGEFTTPPKSQVDIRALKHLAYELVEVPHRKFSAWQRSNAPAAIPAGAWQAVEAMRKAGEVSPISCGDGVAQGSAEWLLENINEEIYPTEYMPSYKKKVLSRWQGPHKQREQGQMVEGLGTFERLALESYPGLKGASLGTSFETRNTGMTVGLKPRSDDSGLLVELDAGYVFRLGDTVHRRIEDNGEWIPDCTMPLFASNQFRATCRMTPGQWTLVGTGSRFVGLGKSDPDKCLLFFVKVE